MPNKTINFTITWEVQLWPGENRTINFRGVWAGKRLGNFPARPRPLPGLWSGCDRPVRRSTLPAYIEIQHRHFGEAPRHFFLLARCGGAPCLHTPVLEKTRARLAFWLGGARVLRTTCRGLFFGARKIHQKTGVSFQMSGIGLATHSAFFHNSPFILNGKIIPRSFWTGKIPCSFWTGKSPLTLNWEISIHFERGTGKSVLTLIVFHEFS